MATKPVLCIAPYLPLRDPVRIGPWHLLPISHAGEVLAGDGLLFARRLAKAYGIKHTDRHGAIAYRRPASPVAPVSGKDMHRLNLALMTATLDANDGAAERQYIAENSLVFAHPVGDATTTAYEEGVLMRTLHGMSLDGRAKISAPAELVIAGRARAIDSDLASSLYKEFARGDSGRRLTLTAEWLQIASRNTSMVALGVRVIAIRSGFETLLDAGSDFDKQGVALHQLVERPTTRRWGRAWKSARSGKAQSADLTALQWWYYRFGFLRNDIAHGSRVRPGAWRWKGEHHLTKAERELLRAMRCELVRLGHKLILALPYDQREDERRSEHIRQVISRHLD